MLMSKLFTAIKGAFSPGNSRKRRRDDMKENDQVLEDRAQEQRKKLEPASGQTGVLEEQTQPTVLLGGEDGQPNTSNAGKYGNLLASVDATEKFGWRRFPTPGARKVSSLSARKDLPTSEAGSAIKGSLERGQRTGNYAVNTIANNITIQRKSVLSRPAEQRNYLPTMHQFEKPNVMPWERRTTSPRYYVDEEKTDRDAAHVEFYGRFLERLQEILDSDGKSKPKEATDSVFEAGEKSERDTNAAKQSWKYHHDRMEYIAKKATASLGYESAKKREMELQQLETSLSELRRLRIEGPKTESVLEKQIPLPVLSDEDFKKYEALLSHDSNAVVLKHERSMVELTGRDMSRLAPGQWLNDEIINLYMRLLQERDTKLHENHTEYPKCHFFNTFFIAKLYKDKQKYEYDAVRRWTVPARLKASGQSRKSILDSDRIFFPVNQSNTHWVCALADLKNRQLAYYDSLKGEDHKCLEQIAQYLKDEFKNKRGEERDDILSWPRNFPKNVPEQRNGYDCGVFLIVFADYLSKAAKLDFTQEDVDLFRAKIALDFSKMSAL